MFKLLINDSIIYSYRRYLEMFDMNSNTRPKYTKYEISKLVKDKFKQSNLSKDEFCKEFNITKEMLESILTAKISFSKKILNICAIILDKSVSELISQEEDSPIAFRSGEINEDTKETCEIANYLFNEIIMQDKIFI